MNRYFYFLSLAFFAASGCDDDDNSPALDAQPSDAALQPDVGVELDADLDAGDAEVEPCEQPLSPTLTVNAIPASMNGTQPYRAANGVLTPFKLLLPTGGFTLDVIGDPYQRLDLVQFGCGGQNWNSLAQRTSTGWRYLVPNGSFTPGDLTCSTIMIDRCTGTGVKGEITVELADWRDDIDPFKKPETWLLVTSRDLWTMDAQGNSSEGANGIADLDEALSLAGLMSNDESQGAATLTLNGVTGVSKIFRAKLLESTRRQLRSYFKIPESGEFTQDSVPINFVLEGEPGAPNAADFSADGEFSMIAIGGSDPQNEALGRAEIDWNNQVQNDNATNIARGIYTSSLARQFVTHPAGAQIFGGLSPVLGGTALGMRDGDRCIFDQTCTDDERDNVTRTRAYLVDRAIDLFGRGLAALTAHEIGHSLGLVPPGAPPIGLFAGINSADFIEAPATGAHIDTDGYNIMQQGAALNGSGIELIAAQPKFNALNLSYLQRRLIVDPKRAQKSK